MLRRLRAILSGSQSNAEQHPQWQIKKNGQPDFEHFLKLSKANQDYLINQLSHDPQKYHAYAEALYKYIYRRSTYDAGTMYNAGSNTQDLFLSYVKTLPNALEVVREQKKATINYVEDEIQKCNKSIDTAYKNTNRLNQEFQKNQKEINALSRSHRNAL